MPRNVYFSQSVKSEQNLYEDLIIESLKIYGQDCYYLPRTIISRDDILNEDRASRFDAAYMIEAYIENSDGFEGAGDLFSKFGLEIRDEASFIISRRQWQKLVGLWNNEVSGDRPREGDILYLPMSNSLFEITFVEHEQPFYQLKNLPVYKLQCSKYEYNEEDFETGVPEIDATQQINSQLLILDVTVTNGQHLMYGETVTYQITNEVSVTGEVQYIDKISSTIAQVGLSNISTIGSESPEQFNVGNTLTGSKSENVVTITKVYDLGDDEFLQTDGQAQNNTFETEVENIIDFSETNPFSELF
jgi:hypothetical protein